MTKLVNASPGSLSLLAALTIVLVLAAGTWKVVEAATAQHRVYTGYVSSNAVRTDSWHDVSFEDPANWAVDIGQGDDPSGFTVRMLSQHMGGNSQTMTA